MQRLNAGIGRSHSGAEGGVQGRVWDLATPITFIQAGSAGVGSSAVGFPRAEQICRGLPVGEQTSAAGRWRSSSKRHHTGASAGHTSIPTKRGIEKGERGRSFTSMTWIAVVRRIVIACNLEAPYCSVLPPCIVEHCRRVIA